MYTPQYAKGFEQSVKAQWEGVLEQGGGRGSASDFELKIMGLPIAGLGAAVSFLLLLSR